MIGDDLVGSGLVTSLARPGGNITGVSILATELDAKRIEVLKELLPDAQRMGVLNDPTTSGPSRPKGMVETATRLGVVLETVDVRGPDDLDAASRNSKQVALQVSISCHPHCCSTFGPVSESSPLLLEFRQFTSFEKWWNLGALQAMASYWRTCTRSLPTKLPNCFEVRNQPICQLLNHLGLSSSSASRRPRHSVLPCRPQCSPAPMR
jgi:ABC transporter substrate binding protein